MCTSTTLRYINNLLSQIASHKQQINFILIVLAIFRLYTHKNYASVCSRASLGESINRHTLGVGCDLDADA